MLVEFALVAPMLCILLCAIIDFSMAMFTMNNLTTAVREGARMAATLPWDAATTATDRAAVEQRVRDQISLSFISRGGKPGTITVVGPIAATGNIEVTIRDFDYVPVFGTTPLPMTRQAVFRWERFQP